MEFSKFLPLFYVKELDSYFRPTALAVGFPRNVSFSFSDNPSCFTRIEDFDNSVSYRIVFGDRFFYDAVKPSSFEVTKKNIKEFYPTLFKVFRGVFWHELAHILYTDMTLSVLRKYVIEHSKAHFYALKHLNNLLEDVFVEAVVSHEAVKMGYQYVPGYFKALTEIFLRAADDYEDNGKFSSFADFLLLRLRLGARFKGTNSFFDSHAADIKNIVSKFFHCSDPVNRQNYVIELYEYLVDNGMEFDSEGDLNSSGYSEVASSSLPPTPRCGPVPPDGEPFTTEQEPEDEQEPEEKFDINEALESGELFQESDWQAFNDDLKNPHVFVDMLTEMRIKDRSIAQEAVETVLFKHSTVISAVSQAFANIDAQSRGHYIGGQISGPRVSVPDVLKGNYRCLARKIGSMPKKDLAVSLVIDNSGSMHGTKSHIAFQAALVFGECCNRLGIPFEIYSFTQGYMPSVAYKNCIVTHVIKSMSQSFDNVKLYMTLLDSTLRQNISTKVPTFDSNVDEISIKHIYEKFKKCGHKDRLMIVLSDGMTCGSVKALTELTNRILSEGTLILGIGLCTDEVKESYKHHLILSSDKDLQLLPKFLGDTLVSFRLGKF